MGHDTGTIGPRASEKDLCWTSRSLGGYRGAPSAAEVSFTARTILLSARRRTDSNERKRPLSVIHANWSRITQSWRRDYNLNHKAARSDQVAARRTQVKKRCRTCKAVKKIARDERSRFNGSCRSHSGLSSACASARPGRPESRRAPARRCEF